MVFENTAAYAQKMDADDPLAGFREKFHIPRRDGQETIYFCGNSLGLQPVTAAAAVETELESWRTLGVAGYFKGQNPWVTYYEALTAPLAELAGAKPVEVTAMNSLTVNLNLLMVSFYRPTKTRHKILIEASAFPSDQYAVKSQISFHGFDPAVSLIELPYGADIRALLEREGENIALVLLGGVNYYTGQFFDIAGATRAAQAKGCIVGVDLAHAIGNLPLRLHDWGVDFAVWCSYKYLNAGPAAPGGCFVHERYADDNTLPRFTGWFGHDKASRFLMGPDFKPIPGAEGWLMSNPCVLGLAPLKASLEIFAAAGMDRLRQKSLKLTGYLEYLLQQRPGLCEIITPVNPEERGCQLSLRTKGGKKVFEALSAAGVVCDWREPDCIRVAPTPLYNTFKDVYRFVNLLEKST